MGTFLTLALQALRNPREAATTLLSLGIPREALVPALALVIVLSVILTIITTELTPNDPMQASLPPLAIAAVMATLIAFFIFGLYRGGRAMGGTGSLPETVLLMTFLQFLLLLGQFVEILLWIAAPPLAGVFVIAVAILAFWININFIDVLHSYGSLLKSLALILAVSLGVALIFMFLLSLSGAPMQGTA
ncbi:YIP1 family protein [Roseitranquillus sediminis]|uniref:YIP1 family protein n=1 Tax=Roseitranquillus sediminis TaxID=2809051 RepID=UPI001D0CA583|nr:YIP1 family protein [Roseitranquillus sediminis]